MTSTNDDQAAYSRAAADPLSTAHIKPYVQFPDRERTIIPQRRVKWWVPLVWGAVIATLAALAFLRPGIDGQGW